MCPEQDSNLHASRHTHLKRARLPIPPPGHKTFQENNLCSFPVVSIRRAENGTRTRDPNLGKVVLYQLSYFRIKRLQFSNCGCKSNIFFLITQLFQLYFSKKIKYAYFCLTNINMAISSTRLQTLRHPSLPFQLAEPSKVPTDHHHTLYIYASFLLSEFLLPHRLRHPVFRICWLCISSAPSSFRLATLLLPKHQG